MTIHIMTESPVELLLDPCLSLGNESNSSTVPFPTRAFAVANEYASWEIDEVIAWETARNMILSLVCVFATALVLISNVRAAVMVMACVLFSMVRITF